MDYALDEARKLIEVHSFTHFPSANKLRELGYHSLVSSIFTHHGGLVRFRELLGETSSSEQVKSELEQVLDAYVGDTNE